MLIKTDHPVFHQQKKITHKIAQFWDRLSPGWEKIWGPHIHHGYYEENEHLTPLQAQEKLLHKLTELIEIPEKAEILDVGCGMGGSSIYLAQQYAAQVRGITLSPRQVQIATEVAQKAGVTGLSFQVEDALYLQSFQDCSIDVVWSLESCEQFFDKKLFLNNAYRVLKPGGKLLLVTWCSSQDEYQHQAAKKYQKLCHEFDLPYLPTINRYRELLEEEKFTIKSVIDWSDQVKKSWEVGVNLVQSISLLRILQMGGWQAWRFARQIKLMRDAFQENRIQYGVFIAEKGVAAKIN